MARRLDSCGFPTCLALATAMTAGLLAQQPTSGASVIDSPTRRPGTPGAQLPPRDRPADKEGGTAIIRGIRAVSDYEYEFQMALMNRHLEPSLETVFMMPAEQYTYLSSRLIKEVFQLGGDVRGLVPPAVERAMRDKQAAGVR